MTSQRGPHRTRLAEIVDLGSFRRQVVTSTAALSAMVAIAMVLAVQFFLAGSAVDAVDGLLDNRAATVTTAVSHSTPGDRLVVPPTSLDPGVAVYSSDGTLVAGDVPAHLSSAFTSLSRVRDRSTRRPDDAFAVLAHPFRTASGTRGVVVLSERLAPYEEAERDALTVSLVAGVVLVAVATGLVAWASRRALAPVAQMARTAETWSEHDLDQRFALGAPSNEIRALGQTLDGLLEKVAGAIVAEQRLTSELAHELRSPLTAVQGTADLVAMRDDLDPQLREDVTEIQRSCRQMATTISSLLALARSQASGSADDACALHEVTRTVVRTAAAPGRVRIDVAPHLRAAVPAELAVRAISPVVDNAVRLADHVVITAHTEGPRVHLTVTDDGPGVSAADVDDLFTAGHTGSGGSGLGLSLSRRIARSVGGDVVLQHSPGGPGTGATFVVTLPTGHR